MHLKIKGASNIDSHTIDSIGYSKTHKDYASVKNEIETLQNNLSKIGYIENKRTPINKVNDSTFTTTIQLKKKYNTIYIYYNNATIDASILKTISKRVFDTYFELEFKTIESTLQYINSKNIEKGFPFSKLRLANITPIEDFKLRADLVLESNKKPRIINNIVIRGYEMFPKSYLNYYFKIKPNQFYSSSAIERKTELFRSLNFANQIKPPEVLFTKDSTTLYLYIEKSKSNSFNGFLGFGTNTETGKLEFDGYLDLNLTNNLNYGESLKLLYKSDEGNQKTFETKLSLPYLFKSPIGINLQLHIFKRDSLFSTVNQSAKLDYLINSNHKIYSGILASQSSNLLSINTNPNIKDYTTKAFTLAYEYKKAQPNNLLFPLHSNLYLETSLGKRTTSDISDKQTGITINTSTIINLNKKNSIFLRVDSSNLISNSYLENELFRFGGINSIRGFEENSLLASFYGTINTEYRLQLGSNLYVHTITDASYFENKILNKKEKLFGYGFGLGIMTKSGLFKLNYANGKSENQKFKLSNSKVHISLISQF
ncbi:POTRA domain-containing protein [Snuella sedimenti]|uniref:POTRA domain-containing protein n=1 Tax=Snuella sedimenti TaxID=2798802 RepID=UPI001E53880E|nr:POTRA domain-containing protein [Snuella sedimenti]